MAKKDSKKNETQAVVKKQAPMAAPKSKKDLEPKVVEEKQVEVVPVKKETKHDNVKNEEKAEAKAAKKASKKAKHDAKPLHFHFFRFIFELLIFVITTLILIIGTYILWNGGISNGNIDIIVINNGMEAFIIGVIIMFAFALWMALFQLSVRRVFRIGRWERIRKAEAKRIAKIEHYKIKHKDKL